MPAQERVVYVEEERDGRLLLGTFAARVQSDVWTVVEAVSGRTADAAIEWGRERAGMVLVTFGLREGSFFSAGATPHFAYPAWPPADLPPLERRAAPEEDWQSRADDASPLVWSVTLRLVPDNWRASLGSAHDDFVEARDRWDRSVMLAAASCRAGWDRDLLDEFVADVERAGMGPYTTMGAPQYGITLLANASTAAAAGRDAAARCTVPPGFSGRYVARPADAP